MISLSDKDSIIRLIALQYLKENNGEVVMRGFDASVDPGGFDVYCEGYGGSIDIHCFLMTKAQSERLALEMDKFVPIANQIVNDAVDKWFERHPEAGAPKGHKDPWFTGFKYSYGKPWRGQIVAFSPWQGKPVYSHVTIRGQSIDVDVYVRSMAEGALLDLERLISPQETGEVT